MTELGEAANHLKAVYDADPRGGVTDEVRAAERRYYLALETAVLATACPTCGVDSGPCASTRRVTVVMWSVDHDLKCHKRRVSATAAQHGLRSVTTC